MTMEPLRALLCNFPKQLRLGKHQFEDMVRTYNPFTLYIHSGFWSIDSLSSYDSIDLINRIYHASVNDHAEHFPRLINEDSMHLGIAVSVPG